MENQFIPLRPDSVPDDVPGANVARANRFILLALASKPPKTEDYIYISDSSSDQLDREADQAIDVFSWL